MGCIRGMNRDQVVRFPDIIDEYIEANNPVRFIDAYVERLDLKALGFTRAVPQETGRPGYVPADMLKLYIYGYLHQIRSSRKLEQETPRTVELLRLLCKLTSDFKTIADFCKDKAQALKQVCQECTVLCKKLDLFDRELLAIDGSSSKRSIVQIVVSARENSGNSFNKFIPRLTPISKSCGNKTRLRHTSTLPPLMS
jgi:transposase